MVTCCEELTHWKRLWCWEDWRQEKWVTKDEMVGCHYRFNGCDFEQAVGDSEEQGSLVCCNTGSQGVEHYWATEQQMYGKMQVSGFTEIIPLLCTSAILDQWSRVFLSWVSSGYSAWENGGLGILFPPWVPSGLTLLRVGVSYSGWWL